MLFLLAIYLILLAILSYHTSKNDIMSPTFILSVLFLFCDLFAIVGNMKWKVQISVELLTAFLVGMSALYLGELSIRVASKGRIISVKNTSSHSGRIDVSHGRMVIIIIIDILLLVLYYKRLVQIASSIGYSGSMLLQYVRIATISNDIRVGTFYTIFLGIISASGYFCIYIITNNIFVAKDKPYFWGNFIYSIPIVIMITSSILSGARNGLIRILVIIFACALIQYQECIKKVRVGKILTIGSITLGNFLILFANLGKLTGKTTVDNFIGVIMKYVGSSIVGLSSWLDKGLVRSSEVFAGESFWGTRYLLNKFFPSVDVGSQFLESIIFPGGSGTNIYTAFRSYLFDFGWIGLSLIMFLIGLVFNACYIVIKRRKNPFTTVLYSYFLYNYINILFAPSITSNLFTSSQIFGIFWMYVLYRFMLRPKIRFKLRDNSYKMRPKRGYE